MPGKSLIFLLFLFISVIAAAQKKPLDHSVYDSWQSIGEKIISNDGKWVVYTIEPQEGDNDLIIQSSETNYKKTIARGYKALITEDSRFVIFKIKPFYKETREARIKKKRRDDIPKDSLGIIELGKETVWKTPAIREYKIPKFSSGWLAYNLEKKPESPTRTDRTDTKRLTDSLLNVVDSLQEVIESMAKQMAPRPPKKANQNEGDDYGDDAGLSDADDDDTSTANRIVIADLGLKNLNSGEEKIFPNVSAYYFNEKGTKLLLKQFGSKDSIGKQFVLLYDLNKKITDTLSRGGNSLGNVAISENGSQVAFIADKDSTPRIKGQSRTYKLWYYKEGMDSAVVLAEKNSIGMQLGMTVSEFSTPEFSKSGKRLFFGTAPIQLPEDTTIADIDKARLDIWHYNDDEIQTVQLLNLRSDLQKNYLAVYDFEKSGVKQLGSLDIPVVYKTNEGDGDIFVGVTDVGRRIESQWTGATIKDIYAINVKDGSQKLVKKDLSGVLNSTYLSSTGKYIMWYDNKVKNYFVWDGSSTKNITAKIKFPLWNEKNDTPEDPNPYGVMGWHEGDSAVYVYDKYDVWRIPLANTADPSTITSGRKLINSSFRYIKVDPEEKFISHKTWLHFRTFNEEKKLSSVVKYLGSDLIGETIAATGPYVYSSFIKAKDANVYVFSKEDYISSPNLYITSANSTSTVNGGWSYTQLSALNPQQKEHNWMTAELFKWKAYDGKESEGIVYKPEDFDPKKKYPLICYFYETLSDGLYNYLPPAPTPSRLNIPFFVSRGYIVFAPDIHYGTGHPGKDAYDYVVSGTRALVKKGFIDSTRMGLQGQSWGGYQVAYIITMTNLYKAAWAGAPVVNMTSAYGGIRWENGKNRQFQYEKTQSRIGATLWEKPELYIESSPLFRLPKVNTPLVIMSNDKDGAVPWYQGIEFYTAMRRLGKKVWMLSYNGEAHNLVERRNKKDISIREQQYFDWLLKGETPAKWITDGVPAVRKGKDWGLNY